VLVGACIIQGQCLTRPVTATVFADCAVSDSSLMYHTSVPDLARYHSPARHARRSRTRSNVLAAAAEAMNRVSLNGRRERSTALIGDIAGTMAGCARPSGRRLDTASSCRGSESGPRLCKQPLGVMSAITAARPPRPVLVPVQAAQSEPNAAHPSTTGDCELDRPPCGRCRKRRRPCSSNSRSATAKTR